MAKKDFKQRDLKTDLLTVKTDPAAGRKPGKKKAPAEPLKEKPGYILVTDSNGREFLMKEKKSERLQVLVTARIIDGLNTLAEKTGTNRNALVNELLETVLKDKGII